MPKENRYTIPNLLSGYRIVALPFIIWALVSGERNLFITLLSVNLVTDILDGYIARKWKLETKLGAKLDSIADIGTYLVAVWGMFALERAFMNEHAAVLITLVVLYLLPQLVAIIKFRQIASLHLYSGKVVAYLQGIFIFTFFIWGHSDWFFYPVMLVSYLSYLEETIAILVIPALKENAKSLYTILKTKAA